MPAVSTVHDGASTVCFSHGFSLFKGYGRILIYVCVYVRMYVRMYIVNIIIIGARWASFLFYFYMMGSAV